MGWRLGWWGGDWDGRIKGGLLKREMDKKGVKQMSVMGGGREGPIERRDGLV